MVNAEDFAAALSQWRNAPFFGVFMKTLASRRDAVVRQLLHEEPAKVEALRGEARALAWIYDKLNQPDR